MYSRWGHTHTHIQRERETCSYPGKRPVGRSAPWSRPKNARLEPDLKNDWKVVQTKMNKEGIQKRVAVDTGNNME
jgi:hypothetical protein